MSNRNSLEYSLEELLTICSRSIVAPDRIVMETNRIIELMNEPDLDRKYIVEGCETLSLLASSFMRSGYDSYLAHCAHSEKMHWMTGYTNKNELIEYCELCVEFGEESLRKIKNALMAQLEIENTMTRDEINDLNIKKYEQHFITVQEQLTNFIVLSLLVNSLKKFFKEYYKGLN